MRGGNIYKELVVRRAEIQSQSDSKRTYFECDLEDGDGKKVSFSLMIEGCVGQKEHQAQYEAVRPYFLPGKLIQCATAYVDRGHCFSMAMYDFMPISGVKCGTFERVDADTYFNPNRGFWTMMQPIGDRVHLPGLIFFQGDVHIPIIEDGLLPHLSHSYLHKEGLSWGRPPSTLGLIWRHLFG